MTEKEKRDAGMLYDANFHPPLLKERDAAKSMVYAFNQLHPTDYAARRELIKKAFRKTGESFTIESPFSFDYGYNITIGENFYANINCCILDGASVTIGDNVFIAPNVVISTAGHPFDPPKRNAGLEYAYPVVIGDDVWIGAGVIILPGVAIGGGTTIGAGSVVTKDIPGGVLAAGNPCRVIRPLTEADAHKYDR